jgi:Domain of unknown function (DUF4340)
MATLSRSSKILFVVALVVVAAYFFVERPRNQAEDHAEVEASQLTRFDPSRVDRIVIQRADDRLDLTIDGDHWQIREPVVDVAEPSMVAQLLETLDEAEIQRDMGTPADLGRYGLATPVAVLTVMAGADTLFKLAVGDDTVDHSATFVRLADGRVVLVTTDVRRQTTLPAAEYRNHRVVSFDLSVVSGFTLSNAAGSIHLERAGGVRWNVIVPGGTVPGDSIAVPDILRQLRGLRARSYVADADTALAFVDARAVIRIDKKNAPSVTIRFAEHAPGVFWARVDGESRVVAIDGSIAPIPSRSLATLRDRRLLQFDPRRAVRLTFSTPDTSAVLVRAGAHWAFPNPAMGTIDPARAADLVRALRALEYSVPLKEKPVDSGGDAVAFSLVVYARGDTILDELRAVPARGDPESLAATSHSAPGWYAMSRSDIDHVVALLRRLGARSRKP